MFTAKLYRIGFFVLLILNLALVMRVLGLQSRVSGAAVAVGQDEGNGSFEIADFLTNTSMPDAAVVDTLGNSFSSRDLISGLAPLVVILFTPGDCQPCLDERDLWADIPHQAGVPALAIVANDDLDEYRAWARPYDFQLPVYIDANYAILDGLGVQKRPLKILFDKQGVARWADDTRHGAPARAKFWRDLDSALNGL
jgi:hypothetical protein